MMAMAGPGSVVVVVDVVVVVTTHTCIDKFNSNVRL